jgi:hypothetical protein
LKIIILGIWVARYCGVEFSNKAQFYLVACLIWRAFAPYFRMYPLLRWESRNYPKIEYSEAEFVQDTGTIIN